ncbi:hypothetical protein HA402_010387 [Bradysia odoriphaga]|nr:hypothetical protein HA402_010387 [Bradysia odoriphaga]
MDLIQPEEEISAINGGDDGDFDEIRQLFDESAQRLVRLRPSDVCNQRLFHNNNNERHMTSFPSALEMNAMSVVSLYDQDYTKEMDCDDTHLPHSTRNVHTTDTPDKKAPNPFEHAEDLSNSLFFIDGLRSIDFVCVWSPADNEETEELRTRLRLTFEDNLEVEGLHLEREVVQDDLHFIKIHAPLEVLRRYSEILKLRMPMKESLCKVHENVRFSSISNAALFISNKIPGFDIVTNQTTTIYTQVKCTWTKWKKRFIVDEDHFPPKSHRFTAVYSRDKEYLFDVHDPTFFTAAIRSRIVKFILDRIRFSIDMSDSHAFGIDRMISDEVYIAAYPLHDVGHIQFIIKSSFLMIEIISLSIQGEIRAKGCMRNLLSYEWAAISKWYRYQPVDYIKDYFGVKIGLYFAWLGYYTYMLLLASIFGICCFLFSWFTLDDDKPSQDICSGALDIKMCPLCDHWCDYWKLEDACFHARTTYLFNNSTTIVFAVFMSFWATLFLELWKRYSAEITHRWDLTGFDVREEHPRPQYLARLQNVKEMRIDFVTNSKEPQPPFWRMKLPATVFSFTIVILLVALAVAAVLGVVLYRMSMLVVLTSIGKDKITNSGVIIFTTATAASINLCLIVVFNWIYTGLAEYLTEFELLRTQTEFDDSLTLKIYLLQFVNYYASIFYIAFFKGKFIGYPGDYKRFLNARQEECGLGGCLMELCIQLAIIMVGKQSMNTVLEMLLPKFYKWLNSMKVWKKKKCQSTRKDNQRWLRDLKLIEWGPRSLFSEYLEMVLQYGFVTIFVAAFPLAPFFALLNNILEMRLDAQKLLTFYRRPVTQRVRNIGVWYRILDSIGKLSVITNGFIIAFTSDVIPRLVYRFQVSQDGTLNGYLNHSLSYFRTTDFQKGSAPKNSNYTLEFCRYPDYREPPDSAHPYERTLYYWTVMAARVCFIVVFENVVAMVMIFVRWCIPDIPAKLRDKIRREAYITNEIIIHQESMKVKSELTNGVGLHVTEPASATANLTELEHLLHKNDLSPADPELAVHGETNESSGKSESPTISSTPV